MKIKKNTEFNVIQLDSLKNIKAGSAVGVLGTTLSGATAGVELCSAGGPYAIAVCGIGGALIGAGFGVWTGA